MKKIIFGLLSLLILEGVSFAQQAEEQSKGSSAGGMMQEMPKGNPGSEGNMQGMGDMSGMMRMMKMMNQCASVMEQCCSSADSGKAKESPKQ